jgi:hypothetical protein
VAVGELWGVGEGDAAAEGVGAAGSEPVGEGDGVEVTVAELVGDGDSAPVGEPVPVGVGVALPVMVADDVALPGVLGDGVELLVMLGDGDAPPGVPGEAEAEAFARDAERVGDTERDADGVGVALACWNVPSPQCASTLSEPTPRARSPGVGFSRHAPREK